jgi:hypothetical protein
MEQEDFTYLSDEAKEAYSAYLRLFDSEHWKAIVNWADENAAQCVARIVSATSWDASNVARGERQAYINLSTLETQVHNQFQNLVDEAKDRLLTSLEEENE